MINIPVTDDEILYRRLTSGRNLYKFRPDGTIQIESEAFSDREFRVSVYRAELCNNDPKQALGEDQGGVVGLLTYDVRSIDDITRIDEKGQVIQIYRIEVEHVPLPDNFAHAEIYTQPQLAITKPDKKVFRRLCHRLAQLAESRPCEIYPKSL